jgi:UDP-N-acetylglucosamine acyltransferase
MNPSIHSATIHPSSVLEGDIDLGENVSIGPFCYLKGPVSIGNNTVIGAGCIIGTDAEHRIMESNGSVSIGNNVIIKEGVVIHKGTEKHITIIDDDCYIMNQSYIAHDCSLAKGVILSSNVCLAGKVHLLNGCNLGMGVLVHQYSTIGAFCMIGMGSVVTKDVLPFSTVYGNPAVLKKWNSYKFSELGITIIDLKIVNGKLVSPTGHPLVQKEILAFYQLSQRDQIVS